MRRDKDYGLDCRHFRKEFAQAVSGVSSFKSTGINRAKNNPNAGVFVIKHCCGNINNLLDMTVDAGIDAIHPLDQTAGMDIAKVQEKYQGRIVVIGGVDCGELLTNKFPEDVIVETKKLLKNVSSRGGHILGSSNAIHPKVKPENYLAMVDTVKKYGKYPININ